MSEVLKTINVVTKSGTHLKINESKFDPKRHKLAKDDADAPKTADPAKAGSKPDETKTEFTPEGIDKMEAAEVDELLAAHGLELKGALKDKREALKEVMFVNGEE